MLVSFVADDPHHVSDQRPRAGGHFGQFDRSLEHAPFRFRRVEHRRCGGKLVPQVVRCRVNQIPSTVAADQDRANQLARDVREPE